MTLDRCGNPIQVDVESFAAHCVDLFSEPDRFPTLLVRRGNTGGSIPGQATLNNSPSYRSSLRHQGYTWPVAAYQRISLNQRVHFKMGVRVGIPCLFALTASGMEAGRSTVWMPKALETALVGKPTREAPFVCVGQNALCTTL